MARIAIVGGGIAGLAAAYELEQQRRAGKPVDWHLFEASDRLGGILETTRYVTAEGEYILEGGPDGWVTEKPWARELAEELGLGDQIIGSRDEEKKTYIWLDGRLVAMPDRMWMMVPEDLATLEHSPLFSDEARLAYVREVERAEELKAAIPDHDESVASFVRRHFGEEVLQKIGAPLLSGVFGGDVAKLSVRAVMPAFVRMESEHGSLIAALQARRRKRAPAQPTFTSLRRGMGSLIDAIVARLPPERVHLRARIQAVEHAASGRWCLRIAADGTPRDRMSLEFDHVLMAVPVDAARRLLTPMDPLTGDLIPVDASSAILTCFCWSASAAEAFAVPQGFGFLVPQVYIGSGLSAHSEDKTSAARHTADRSLKPKLLACTFVDQKFPHRAPLGARLIRVFFGGETAHPLHGWSDDAIAAEALAELQRVLPGMPGPDASMTTVRRWPRSLPQYEVGHLERIAELEQRIAALGKLHLLGNGYRGVGVPDLIRDARAAARDVAAESH